MKTTNKPHFPEMKPHPDPVDPAQLLDEIYDLIRTFVILTDEQAAAVTLWIAHTYFMDIVEITALLLVNSPEKACGKTQLLLLLERLTYRPLSAANASPSALFRVIEEWRPTILIDEADTFFKDNMELRGMINAGYSRDGAILRSESVGTTFEPRSYSVFSPKAIAGISLEKHLPDATMSRGIPINLRKKLKTETVSRLRYTDKSAFAGYVERLMRFSEDYSIQAKVARPTLPDELSDRAQDIWEILIIIAACAGDEWVTRATAAALKLSGAGEKVVSTGNELLVDIQHIFKDKKLDTISTADLIAALIADDEKSWATYNRGKQISGRQIATRLLGYGICSKSIRRGCEVFRGFELSQFVDAFARYLVDPISSVTTLQTSTGAGLDVTDRESVTVTHPPSVTREAALPLGCNVVTEKKPILGSTEASRTTASHLRI